MGEFTYQVLIRLAVMLPAIGMVAALAWFALKKFGVVKTRVPLDARDMRTWPLWFVLSDAALFAGIFALVSAWIREGEWGTAVAGGISAFVAIGLAPRLFWRGSRLELQIPPHKHEWCLPVALTAELRAERRESARCSPAVYPFPRRATCPGR